MRFFLRITLLLSLLSSFAVADLTFPKLTGRVVDNASLLSSSQEQRLTQFLKAHEDKTTNQVVVVTLPTLQGYTIEEYGVELGRHWGIGQKEKNNGILLIVAPKERKVRIEVGYGLEGTLTDKIAHDIIQEKILPAFKRGKYDQGIENGTSAILQALDGEYQVTKVTKSKTPSQEGEGFFTFFIFGLVFLFWLIDYFVSGKKGTTKFYIALAIATAVAIPIFIIFWDFIIALIAWIFVFMQVMAVGLRTTGYGSSSSFSGGGSSFGGFSGGGGSFGGGGASGSW
jgi:uncharacterized protein